MLYRGLHWGHRVQNSHWGSWARGPLWPSLGTAPVRNNEINNNAEEQIIHARTQ